MDRSFEWRYPNPFRVTPGDKPGAGHWEGSGKRWEQSGSGYIQLAGDVFFELDRTVDEGYDIPNNITKKIINGGQYNYSFEDDPHLIIDEEYEYPVNTEIQMYNEDGTKYFYKPSDNFTWYVYKKRINTDSVTYTLYAEKVISSSVTHVPVYFDYWNTWIYRNLNWEQIGSGIRRSHV